MASIPEKLTKQRRLFSHEDEFKLEPGVLLRQVGGQFQVVIPSSFNETYSKDFTTPLPVDIF